MPEALFEIAQDEKTNSKLVAGPDDILVGFGEKRKFEQDRLSDPVFADHSLEVF